jgi:hypothetical protein
MCAQPSEEPHRRLRHHDPASLLQPVQIDLPERIRALEPSEFPQLSAAADRYANHLSDQAFEAGLELLLAGLRDRGADQGAGGVP